ncbi:MAG TPA: hypothetical protein VH062_21665 [Polyangiaceae bacterium]|jgi:hypothetical protein|nr:hypothetical protein [Polyangiaceae bacterium]
MRANAVVIVLSTLLASVACGSGDAENDCDKVVDAYAHAWQRCMRETYDEAKKTFSDALMCGKASSSNSAQVDTCVSALDAQDCAAVTNNTVPTACNDTIKQ